MKKVLKSLCIMSIILGASLMLSLAVAEHASAASYQIIYANNYETGMKYQKKVGKYHFKTKYDADNTTVLLYRSKKKNSGYRLVTELGWNPAVTNGTRLFRISPNGKRLQKITLASGKTENLKKLNTPQAVSWRVQAVVGKKVYLERWDYFKGFKTYIYYMKTGKLKRANIDVNIATERGARLVGSDRIDNEMNGTMSLYLFQATTKGFKNRRLLTSMGQQGGAWYVGKRLYYLEFASALCNKAHLYRCKADGSARKKIATFTSSGTISSGGAVILRHLCAKYCIFQNAKGTWRYTFKTKKKKLLEKYEF